MTVVDFIERLRKLPPSSKMAILWVTTAIIMLGVGGLWIASVKSRVATIDFSKPLEIRTARQTISEFTDSTKTQFAQLRSIIGELFSASPTATGTKPRLSPIRARLPIEESKDVIAPKAPQPPQPFLLPLPE